MSRSARRPRALGLAAVTLAVTMVAAGCGSSSSSSKSGATTAGGGTLTLAVTTPPAAGLNPFKVSTDATDDWYLDLAYSSLLTLQPGGGFTGDLATSWSPKSNNTILDLKLRSGVKFSDGSAVTAKDVAASLNYWRKNGGNGPAWGAPITSITATGPLTVQINTSTPDPILPLLLDQSLVAGFIVGPKGMANPSSLGTTTDGAGPYMIDQSETVANSRYTYVRNPYFWDKSAVRYDKVVITVITNIDSALNTVRSGEAQALVGTTDVAATAKSDGLKLYTEPSSIMGIDLLDRDGKMVPALKSQLVREALNYAVNRPAIAKAVFDGYAAPDEEMEAPGYAGYDSAVANSYAYNPAKAKSLLAQAGYPHGFTIKAEALNLVDIGTVAQAIIGYWEAIGVKVQYTSDSTVDAWVTDVLTKKQFPADAFIYGALPMYLESKDFISSTDTIYNVDGITDPTATSGLATAAKATGSAQNADYATVVGRVAQLGWLVPAVAADEVVITAKSLCGVQLGADDLWPNDADFHKC